MRTRAPRDTLTESLNEYNFSEATEHTESYTVKIITPIYGGGVKAGVADEVMPIRAAAIRGQLRYWWRLLQTNKPDAPIGRIALFDAEREIWGGMAEDGKDYSSNVFIKITDNSEMKSQPCCEYLENGLNDRGNMRYRLSFKLGIPAYAIFPGQGKPPSSDNYDESTDSPHHVIPAGGEFTLTVRTSDQLDEEQRQSVTDAIRWWASFGGIGARTRRGLGSVEVSGLGAVTVEEANLYGCQLKQVSANNRQGAWVQSVEKLQQFRQGVGVGRNRGNGNRPGRSRWPEPDSIREITNKPGHTIEHPARLAFPRAAFGLPIIYEIRGNGEPDKTELVPCFTEANGKTTPSTRMSSPLILKAMSLGGNTYSSIALLLPTEHIKSLDVQLKWSGNNSDEALPKDFAANEWWEASKADKVEPIYTNSSEDKPATDALSAFLNYFEGN